MSTIDIAEARMPRLMVPTSEQRIFRGGSADPLTTMRNDLIAIVKAHGLKTFAEPLQLASGEWSCDFIDGKRALARGADLKLACRALIEAVAERGVEWDAVGGLTLGADQFAHVTAVLAEKRWFVVRKQTKGRGTNQKIEGASIDEATRVLLVDDVVTTGGSIQQAYEAIREVGATVVGAVTLVDRGDTAARFFEGQGVPYIPLVTYKDLEIVPVGAAAAI